MITLSSDFGSPYPAAMKGTILSRTDARLVDVSHDFPRHDVRVAAFWLEQVLPSFPAAVHLVVVDPGVGTDRSVLVVEAGNHVLVGPDNGVLVPAAKRLAEQPVFYDVEHEAPEIATFHGRDVFAPLAADLHEEGIEPVAERRQFTSTDAYVEIERPEPVVGDRTSSGIVLAVDDFGNAITTIPGVALTGHFGETVEVNGVRAPIARTYGIVDRGHPLVTVGSHGNVELAVNRGRGDVAFDVSTGDDVRLAIEDE